MLRKFINWFKKDHTYNTVYVDFCYYKNYLEVLPACSVITGMVVDNGVEISWLWFNIWFHGETY